jgi:hypothetical protein
VIRCSSRNLYAAFATTATYILTIIELKCKIVRIGADKVHGSLVKPTISPKGAIAVLVYTGEGKGKVTVEAELGSEDNDDDDSVTTTDSGSEVKAMRVKENQICNIEGEATVRFCY